MLKSMTGFGRSEMLVDEQYEIKIQIKSVNHRYADFMIKVPRIYGFLEESVRAELAQSISRGKVEVYITINKLSGDDKQIKLNEDLAKSYIENLRKLTDYGVTDDISASAVARFSDIFDVQYSEIDEDAMLKMITPVLSEALDNFLNMRISEGQRLKSSIIAHLQNLREQVEKVEERSPKSLKEYEERLRKRLTDSVASLDITADEGRILTEVAVFADKIAVDEETVRLKSHINEFLCAVEANEPIGKKLDFIVQEMNRETNTIGSKANDFELSKTVVEMKSIIEKIREQIQNIE